ncbi:hypothetical protein AVEN_39079-1 [Araneus ventricosus]|uniref:Single domain-containing protein n=1 Tax=Araneus ventricosus TaxID=182803 RepID=A0A4Y2DEE1_ARAVE|nr:hypothetical protein AVEN_39079-1 [Araneus ventricosus]
MMKQINMLIVLLGAMLAFFPPDINADTFQVETEVKDGACYTKQYGPIPKGKSYTGPGCVQLTCGDDGVSGSSCPVQEDKTPDATLGPGCHMEAGVGDYPDCCTQKVMCQIEKKL